MIVRDEAERLARCLQSAAAAVDEMIVVDTGSVDETMAIAQAFGAKVFSMPWQNDFAIARNESLRHATGDWVLVLDADETLVADCVPLLRQTIQAEHTLVINLLRQEVGAVQSPYSLVSRLFRRHPDLRFARPYHATIDDAVATLLQQEPTWGVVDLSQVAILHDGYDPVAIARRDKLEKARSVMEGYWQAHPDDPYECSKLGALYVQMGEVERGIQLLQRGLQSPLLKASQMDAPVRYELHYHLGIAHTRLNQLDTAAQHYQAALQQPLMDPLKLGAYNNLGSLCKTTGDLATARQFYEQCLAIDPGFAAGHYNLGTTLRAQGQITDAVTHYQAAIRLQPDHAEAHQNLGVALIKLGQVEAGLASFGRAIALHAQTNPAQAERLRQGLKEMGFAI
ncbi:MAG: glycosyltransferase [Cyanobacteria bacterium J069]|nr:MAG: tetratricopeptide repeat protein [Cyanobacteria bacterium J069]